MKTFTHVIPSALLTASLLLSPSASMADDTEIYFARANADSSENKPVANVMIMLDTSGSMRYCESGSNSNWCNRVNDRRINILEDAMKGILDNMPESVNLGLGRFNSGADGGQILMPIVPVNDVTRPTFDSALANINPQGGNKSPSNSVSPNGGTPTARAYAEIARYMLGLEPVQSYTSPPRVTVCNQEGSEECAGFPRIVETAETKTWTVRECNRLGFNCSNVSKSSTNYVSPVNEKNQCESNHVILFTDGEPSNNESLSLDGKVSCNSNTGNYLCQTRIAGHLNSESNSKGVTVSTHNIGLYMGDSTFNNMKLVSDAGGGATYDSDNAETLLAAFMGTLDLIDDETKSITSPGVAVNAMNRFQHLDELYYSVFRPVESSYWEGNLKRYQLDDGEIKGVNGNAIDAATGSFREGAKSFWSGVTDGANVTEGGARNEVSSRNLFYNADPTKKGLTRLNLSSPTTPSNEFFGLAASATPVQRAELLNRLGTMWGDPLHSVPVMVNYGKNENNNYVFVSNNGGMLHAIKTSDGSEAFAFMPNEFIKKANKYTVERPALGIDNSRQIYGLDGSWIPWRKPGETAEDAPKAVYLYGGMRRGGRSYYALNVTTPASPKILWRISNETAGFERLGQTWSTPTLTSIPSGSGTGTIPVLVFGGGYSPADHDYKTTRSGGDAMGNAVYIVNAEDGSLIWSASSAAKSGKNKQVGAMKWAVPGGISVVDMDFDGVAEHLYYADLGGQVFRVDIDGSGGSSYAVERLAELSGGSGVTNRRFFEAPSVGYVKDGAKNVLYVSLGSGYRSHPLDEVTQDGFFVIKDEGALGAAGNTGLATTTSMSNVTSGGPLHTGTRGWFYYFDRSGEKSMSSPVIYDGKILFTTYAPTADQEQENVCAVRYGESFLHTVELLSGRPAALVGEAPSTRSQRLAQSTPPPTPVILVDEDGDFTTLVGTEIVGEPAPGDPSLRKRRWMQLPKSEANVIRKENLDEGE